MLNIKDLRREYTLKPLDLSDLNTDPFLQFSVWFEEAQQAGILELNAMNLATASLEGHPSCRTVLLKQMDEKGFSFFTNYNSCKGQELAKNPYACINFYWAALERQVIIKGQVETLSRQESENYFATRPKGSQIATWASHQSQIVNSRKELEEAYRHFEKMYEEKIVPLPPYWGGYRLVPTSFEFWQGRANRLHDRFRYLLEEKNWKIARLSP